MNKQKQRLIVTPEQLKKGWVEFRPEHIPNEIHHDYRNPISRADGNYEVDEPKAAEAKP